MVRLKDIAREAGVSVMTVSKALRDAPDIAAKTKLRIGDLAKRRSEEHTSELQSRTNLVCRLLLEKKKKYKYQNSTTNTQTS